MNSVSPTPNYLLPPPPFSLSPSPDEALTADNCVIYTLQLLENGADQLAKLEISLAAQKFPDDPDVKNLCNILKINMSPSELLQSIKFSPTNTQFTELVHILNRHEQWSIVEEILDAPSSALKMDTKGDLLEAITRCFQNTIPNYAAAIDLVLSASEKGLFKPHPGLTPEQSASMATSLSKLRQEFMAVANARSIKDLEIPTTPQKNVRFRE